jgi:lysozyme family protein
MIRIVYDDAMKADYQHLFNACQVRDKYIPQTDALVKQIAAHKLRYEAVAKVIGCPWYVVGCIHNLECGLSFAKHLHNGDPLSAKTTHVPANRPAGSPPWTWEESATDALRLVHLDSWHDWSVPGILYKLEGYNGYGYRQYHPEVKSPYLWSGTNQYTKGKYIADGHYDKDCVSQQLGIAAILKRGEVLKLFI